MIEKLLTEQPNLSSQTLDELPNEALLGVINAADCEVPAAVAREIPRIAKAVEALAAALEQGARLFYIGSGTSGRLGVLDAAECPPTFDVSPALVRGIIAGGQAALTRAVEGAEDNAEAGFSDLLAAGFHAGDAVIGISASGRTPYVLHGLSKARAQGAVTAGISCTPQSELSAVVEFPIEPLPGPEVLTGSTRMRAGTATKLVLNMISTAVMVRLGHVYGNLMVNVQPTNAKLKDRAERIIAQSTGATRDRAAALLDEAGSVRAAIVMEKLAVDRQEAERRLANSRGRIREALRPSGSTGPRASASDCRTINEPEI